MNVRLIIGTEAYAVINTPQIAIDIRLQHGKSASKSLRETAADWRAKAARYKAHAKIADEAAAALETK